MGELLWKGSHGGCWLLPTPKTSVQLQTLVKPRNQHKEAGDMDEGVQQDVPQLYCVRDDLLHPLWGGNKARKLDALLPNLLATPDITDVVRARGTVIERLAAYLAGHLSLEGRQQPDMYALSMLTAKR